MRADPRTSRLLVLAMAILLLGPTLALHAAATANQAPDARLTVSPADDLTFVSRTFSAAASSDPDGTIIRYVFAFGDGTTDVDGAAKQTTHAYDLPGTYTATVRVYDDQGAPSALASVEVLVRNRPPVLDTVGNRLVDEGDALAFTIRATDPEGQTLTLTLGPLPSGASFTDNGDGTGRFAWNPGYDAAGQYNVAAAATDGSGSDSEPFVIAVRNIDRPPTVLPTADVSTRESFATTVTVRATDPEGDPIRLSISASPQLPGATFNDLGDGSGRLSWTPPAGSLGVYNITVIARSGQSQTSRTFRITVEPAFERVGAETLQSHPGAEVVLTARIHNPFAAAEDLVLWATDTAGWTLSVESSLTLQPGETRDIQVRVAPGKDAESTVKIHAVSSFAATSTLSHSWKVELPILFSVVPDDDHYDAAEAAAGPIEGTIRLAYLDGAPADADLVRVQQSPSTAPLVTRSSVVAMLVAPGEHRYSFRAGGSPTAFQHGWHDLTLTAERNGIVSLGTFDDVYSVLAR